MAQTVSILHSRLSEASRAQLTGWLEGLTEAYEPYISSKPWWTMPTECAAYVAGEKLAHVLGLVSAELRFRDGLAAEAA
jgi:hypothetical protein